MVYTVVLETTAERIESSSLSSPTKICTKCGEEKPQDSFAWKNRQKGTKASMCKLCHNVYSSNHYRENTDAYIDKASMSRKRVSKRNREFIVEYLMKNPCVDCGETDIEVLQFDHIDLIGQDGKRVTSFIGSSLETLSREIAKCEVRCANCHFRRTRLQLGWPRR